MSLTKTTTGWPELFTSRQGDHATKPSFKALTVHTPTECYTSSYVLPISFTELRIYILWVKRGFV